MKHLFFVSVAAGIFSGTSISAEAQTSVNSLKFGSAPLHSKSVKFIEGIEVKRDAAKPAEEVDLWAAPIKKTASAAVKTEEANKVNTAVKTTSAHYSIAIEDCKPLQFKYAQLMDVEVEALSNTKLYEVIEEWWGTRYRYGGTTKKGIDCSAFTGTLYNQAYSITLPRTARDQFAQCDKIGRDALQEGDLVFFNTRGGVSHVGLYLGNGYFAHSSTRSGVTISSLEDDYYSRKYIGGGRINTAKPE
ncbi:MAG: NlpC/P60 family protein [Ferruginibacter sp.]